MLTLKCFEATVSENEIGEIVVDRALRVHQALGPGLLESAYEACLCFELRDAGLHVDVQKALPVVYKDVKLDCGFLINFNVKRIKEGIRRVVNNLEE